MKVWNKLDEVLGAAMLTTVALTSIVLGYNSGVATACITGIVALLAIEATKKRNGVEVIESVKLD